MQRPCHLTDGSDEDQVKKQLEPGDLAGGIASGKRPQAEWQDEALHVDSRPPRDGPSRGLDDGVAARFQ